MVAACKNVLIVDDEEVVRKSFSRALTEAGYRVNSAEDGSEAIARSHEEPPDLVLMDLKLRGELDGLSTVRKVRETQPEVPVLVITGYPSPETEQEAERIGVSGDPTKPLSPSMLTEAASKAISEYWQPPPMAVGQALGASASGGVATVGVPLPADGLVDAVEVAADEVLERVSTKVDATVETLKNLGLLIAAPFIGLAYVVFLPFVGFAVMAGLAGEAIWGAIRRKGE